MSRARWNAYLHSTENKAKIAHAEWAARRIAAEIITIYKTAKWRGSEIDGHIIRPDDVLDTLKLAQIFYDRLRRLAVHPKLEDMAFERMQERIAEQLRTTKQQPNPTPKVA